MAISSSAVVTAYFSNASSAVDLWLHHKTYGYALVVPPIIAFLVWRERPYFAAHAPTPTLAGCLPAAVFAAAWFAGAHYHVLELQHLALAGMIAALVITAIGLANAAHLWLPIAYLFLLAPSGTPLLPYLQTIATTIAVFFLGLGQIPFYVDENYIEVTTGNYVVAPGCAGLNFVLAMATVAPLFAVLMYDSWRKRLLAIALMMAVVPIANGFRVFAIIAIAEYTNRAIDITADHLLYGWLFFSAVVLVLFWIGRLFADPPPLDQAPARAAPPAAAGVGRALAIDLATATLICVTPAFVAMFTSI